MKSLALIFALTFVTSPARALVDPNDVRPSTICSAFLDRVEDAGPPTHPMRAKVALKSVESKLWNGIVASKAKLGQITLLQRIKDFFTVPFRARGTPLDVFASDDVSVGDLTKEQMYVHGRIADAIDALQAQVGGLSDLEIPVRRISKGREAIAKYIDELIAFSISSEEQVREKIASNRRAAEDELDAINMSSHERLLNLREKKGLESQPGDDEARFGKAFRAKWFGPSTSFSYPQKAAVAAGYGATALAASTLTAFFAPLAVPMGMMAAAFGSWFGVRYHLYHLAEKAAIHIRADYRFKKWKHWDTRVENRREAKAPRAETWLANLGDLRDFARRTDVPRGLAYHTYDVHLPLDMKFFGADPALDGQSIRDASASKNPGRFLSRLARVTQTLEFDETNEPVLTTTVQEVPNDITRPNVAASELFGLMMFVTPK